MRSLKLEMKQGKNKKREVGTNLKPAFWTIFLLGFKESYSVLTLTNLSRSLEQQLTEMFHLVERSSESKIKCELPVKRMTQLKNEMEMSTLKCLIRRGWGSIKVEGLKNLFRA